MNSLSIGIVGLFSLIISFLVTFDYEEDIKPMRIIILSSCLTVTIVSTVSYFLGSPIIKTDEIASFIIVIMFLLIPKYYLPIEDPEEFPKWKKIVYYSYIAFVALIVLTIYFID